MQPDGYSGQASPSYVGMFLGTTQLVAFLGRGFFGHVYQGIQTMLANRPVAVKIIAPEHAAAPGVSECFLQEARAMGALEHPNIIEVHTAAVQPVLYIEMAFHPNGTLRRLIGTLAPPQALWYALHLAQALACAHAAGVVHCDVKADNVLLAKDGRPILSDFGIARLAHVLPARQVTPMGNASPEQLQNPGQVDGRTDVYALCLLLYELVAGSLPLPAPGVPPPPIANVAPWAPVEVQYVLSRGLVADPAGRYQSAAALAYDIDVACQRLAAAAGAYPARGRRW